MGYFELRAEQGGISRNDPLTIIRLQAIAAALLQLVVVGAAQPRQSVSYVSNSMLTQRDVFVVAHQDDWQLFLGDVAAKKIAAGDSVTFIYLTAGDDGRDSLYWQTRERAALQSTRLAIGVDATDSTAVRCSTIEALAHAIHKCVIANTESYFLRLPDGKRNGAGFARQGYQSLRKLREKRIATITAIDGSAAYLGCGDLIATASVLVRSSPLADIVVHVSDPSVVANPYYHFDHRMAGLLVNDLRKRQKWNTQYYVGYALSLIHISEPTRLGMISYAVFCLKT